MRAPKALCITSSASTRPSAKRDTGKAQCRRLPERTAQQQEHTLCQAPAFGQQLAGQKTGGVEEDHIHKITAENFLVLTGYDCTVGVERKELRAAEVALAVRSVKVAMAITASHANKSTTTAGRQKRRCSNQLRKMRYAPLMAMASRTASAIGKQ